MSRDAILDGTIGTGAIAAPWWMQLINSGLHEALLVGGVVLVVLRVLLATREWRHGDPQ
jgi:hypothetical protein